MGGTKAEYSAFDRTFGGNEPGLGLIAIECSPAAVRLENHADLVGENLLGCTHSFKRIGVDHLVKLSYQEQIRKYRKLNDKCLYLLLCLLASSEPCRVTVIGNNAVLEKLVVYTRLERQKTLRLLDRVAFLSLRDRLQARLGQPNQIMLLGKGSQRRFCSNAHIPPRIAFGPAAR